MPKNKISDLRNHLFETLEALKDEDKPMDIERALAVATVAGVIIDSAKAEIKFMEVTDEIAGADFFDVTLDAPRLVRGDRKRERERLGA